MGYDDEAICFSDINACADYDSACLTIAACDDFNLIDCTANVSAGYDCNFFRKQKLFAKKSVAMDLYPYVSGIYMYGEDTISSSYPVYCDHYHLYSFYYDTVTPV